MSIITPHWVRHAVFYQIFPDRFAKSEHVAKPSTLESWDSKPTQRGFKGGDLLGVVEKLDYLKDLGITALYLNPIFQSTANHRYHTHDFLKVDPILGGDAAFDTLIKQAHKKDIRIVLDGVFNHASRGFYQFSHALENGASSPYLDWFHIHGFPLHAYEGTPKYKCWWDIPDLPSFNTSTAAVREYLWGVGEYWISRGIDGWRLDVPAEIDDDSFWQEFRRRVKTANPEAYIVGEIWHEAQRWLRGDQFDAVMNYPVTRASVGFFTQGHIAADLKEHVGYGEAKGLDASGFAYALNTNLALYDKAINDVQFNLLDSHDTPRFLTLAKGDKRALRLALLNLLTLPGAPCIYYGDEIGMAGGKEPDSRRAFVWDEALWDHELREHTRAAIKLRKKHRALRDGSFQVLYAAGSTVAYLRAHDDERFIVIFNAGDEAATIDIHTSNAIADDRTFKSVFGPKLKARSHAGMLSTLTIPAREGAVLKES
jgi:cyclomaltodextrinase / maltogenic alpha-amylase / neopullulanase